MEEKQMTYDEFMKQYGKSDEKWRFDLFDIRCKKCGSIKVEFNGDMVDESGYYGESHIENRIVVKCHDCGNAFALVSSADVSGSWGGCGD